MFFVLFLLCVLLVVASSKDFGGQAELVGGGQLGGAAADELRADRVEEVGGDAVEDPLARHRQDAVALVGGVGVGGGHLLTAAAAGGALGVRLDDQEAAGDVDVVAGRHQLGRRGGGAGAAEAQHLVQLLDADVAERPAAAEGVAGEEQPPAVARPPRPVLAVHVQHLVRLFVHVRVLPFQSHPPKKNKQNRVQKFPVRPTFGFHADSHQSPSNRVPPTRRIKTSEIRLS